MEFLPVSSWNMHANIPLSVQRYTSVSPGYTLCLIVPETCYIFKQLQQKSETVLMISVEPVRITKMELHISAADRTLILNF